VDLAHRQGRDVVAGQTLERGEAPGPSISNSPMWLTSKRPTAAAYRPSAPRLPVYCTGISQPPKGTMRAPALTCAS